MRVIVTEGRITTGLVLPSSLGLNKSFFTRFSVGDSLGFDHPVDAPTTFHLWGNGVEFFEAEGTTRITSITIPAGASQTPQFRVVGTATGIASVEVTNIQYRTERGQVHVTP